MSMLLRLWILWWHSGYLIFGHFSLVHFTWWSLSTTERFGGIFTFLRQVHRPAGAPPPPRYRHYGRCTFT